MSDSPQTLAETLKKYDITLHPKKVLLLEKYCEELWSWNEKINLTRHTDYEKFVTRDLIDSIELAKFLQKGEHVLDVGTGGGVPGVLLAILRTDITVELCDSTGKKAKAVGEIVEQLGLDTPVWYAKGQDLVKVHRFHTLVIRAVSKMEKLLRDFAPCWYAFDRILMIKGPNWVEERGESRHLGRLNSVAIRRIAEYASPGSEHHSVILQFCQKSQFEELKQRDADREAGKPINRRIEAIAIDNRPPTSEPAGKRPAKRSPRNDNDPPRKKYRRNG